ncbi:LexA family transcriptional regulator [Galbibacter pacificus]|uniref:LexA family transcriptional regulator n=1 Tax=Galbibacter pacificus TaxID=2996052 RepID=A0ABT6FWJ6_9FLAO|nr:LexA family transcriptional regulator [Galbibacter pacificus]MDG3584100.1 LexA family transcriptional regulator [Galbibacter pacificus]MDG3587467.1 LexA family transcriptional regulator [Galbibacter pacificus]
MKSKLPIEVTRFKEIREKYNFTQQTFAETLGIKSSTADIERGKSKISGSIVVELMEQFKVNPLWLYGKSNQKELSTTVNTAPKILTVTPENNDGIVLVNVKAAAGYPHNIQDLDWYEELPAFTLPLPEYRNATYRGFQVEGDSMLPGLHPKEWVLGKSVENVNMLNNHAICVVVLHDSVLVKKVQKHDNNEHLSLISLNPEYPPITINTFDIQELWEVKSKISMELDGDAGNIALSQIQQSITELKSEIQYLKNK